MRCGATSQLSAEEITMLDVILIAVGCGLFWLAVAYVDGCHRL
jgi:hypothetical protein